LQSLGQIAARIGKQGASGNLALPLSLAHTVALADRSKVIAEPSRNGFTERELARERQFRGARSASSKRSLSLNCWVDRVHAGCCSGYWRLHCGHRPSLSSAPRERKWCCLRTLRSGRRRSNEQSTQAEDRSNFNDPANWCGLCLTMIHFKVPRLNSAAFEIARH